MKDRKYIISEMKKAVRNNQGYNIADKNDKFDLTEEFLLDLIFVLEEHEKLLTKKDK